MLISDFDLFNFVLPISCTMLTELGSENGETNLSLLNISSSNFDKDVLGVQSNLGLVRVDDRRQRKYLAILVVEHWIFLEGFQNWQEFLHLDIVAEYVKECVAIHFLGLFESLEYDFAGRVGLVSDWSSDLIKIVGAH